jgi:phage I-like protein
VVFPVRLDLFLEVRRNLMPHAAGYLVDLATVTLDESNGAPTSWIQAMTVGKYMHPVHGVIDITPERITRFAENVNNKVREQDLDIDYDHKAKTDEAAGWVKTAESRPNGLYLLIEWTSQAAEKIKSKAYRYFSPEFDDEWTHPKSGQKFQDVLFGGGITNRPFLKDILPINLSEAFAADAQVATQGGKMDLKKLAELLGLSVDATEEQVTTALTEKLAAKTQTLNEPKGGDTALAEQLQKLAETNPLVKQLSEQLAAQEKQLAEVGVTLRLSEVTNQVTQLSEVGTSKGRIFPPATADAIKGFLVKTPKQFADEALAVFTAIAEQGLVELGERGGAAGDHESGADPQTVFASAVKKFQDDHKDVSYADATEAVAKADPKLFSELQAASYSFRA